MTIPVIVFKSKSKEDRYLALSPDAGDWSDPDLDVSIEDIERARMIYRDDLTKPDATDVEEWRRLSNGFKKAMRESYGYDAPISFDVELWLKHYEPVNIELTQEQFDAAKEWDE
ncbi:hypothetical protein KM908_20330 [Alkalihalobacillus clausii]|uniref:hypothetical protein n=1 Tax=Shouchella clausii TaxID=79880 RepID=UPI001C251395|nr:hypothetical protein [Shouchella clausii]MBU8598462.1 hypothetical protein [Shouchella clausii]